MTAKKKATKKRPAPQTPRAVLMVRLGNAVAEAARLRGQLAAADKDVDHYQKRAEDLDGQLATCQVKLDECDQRRRAWCEKAMGLEEQLLEAQAQIARLTTYRPSEPDNPVVIAEAPGLRKYPTLGLPGNGKPERYMVEVGK